MARSSSEQAFIPLQLQKRPDGSLMIVTQGSNHQWQQDTKHNSWLIDLPANNMSWLVIKAKGVYYGQQTTVKDDKKTHGCARWDNERGKWSSIKKAEFNAHFNGKGKANKKRYQLIQAKPVPQPAAKAISTRVHRVPVVSERAALLGLTAKPLAKEIQEFKLSGKETAYYLQLLQHFITGTIPWPQFQRFIDNKERSVLHYAAMYLDSSRMVVLLKSPLIHQLQPLMLAKDSKGLNPLHYVFLRSENKLAAGILLRTILMLGTEVVEESIADLEKHNPTAASTIQSAYLALEGVLKKVSSRLPHTLKSLEKIYVKLQPPETISPLGIGLLHQLAKSFNPELLMELLRQLDNVILNKALLTLDNNDTSLFHIIMRKPSYVFMDFLPRANPIILGAALSLRDNRQYTLIYLAVQLLNAVTMGALLDIVEARLLHLALLELSFMDNTPLHCTSTGVNDESFMVLLRYIRNDTLDTLSKRLNKHGKTALHEAIKYRSEKAVYAFIEKLLFSLGPHDFCKMLLQKDTKDRSSLALAAKYKPKVFEYLLRVFDAMTRAILTCDVADPVTLYHDKIMAKEKTSLHPMSLLTLHHACVNLEIIPKFYKSNDFTGTDINALYHTASTLMLHDAKLESMKTACTINRTELLEQLTKLGVNCTKASFSSTVDFDETNYHQGIHAFQKLELSHTQYAEILSYVLAKAPCDALDEVVLENNKPVTSSPFGLGSSSAATVLGGDSSGSDSESETLTTEDTDVVSMPSYDSDEDDTLGSIDEFGYSKKSPIKEYTDSELVTFYRWLKKQMILIGNAQLCKDLNDRDVNILKDAIVHYTYLKDVVKTPITKAFIDKLIKIYKGKSKRAIASRGIQALNKFLEKIDTEGPLSVIQHIELFNLLRTYKEIYGEKDYLNIKKQTSYAFRPLIMLLIRADFPEEALVYSSSYGMRDYSFFEGAALATRLRTQLDAQCSTPNNSACSSGSAAFTSPLS